jgi:murein DD-endopeptidase MepM/ murein hydrolase activator NlpD
MTMRFTARAAALPLLAIAGLAGPARAQPTVKLSSVRPGNGDPVLVTVTDAKSRPKGKVDGKQLLFFESRGGYQAVFAVPLERKPGPLTVTLRGGLPSQTIDILDDKFPETQVQVPDEFVNLTPELRKRVDEDNRAIRKSFGKANGPPQFRRAFQWPVTSLPTSPFGEMRTFNGVARSHHLGMDLASREGAKIRSINEGTVVLVRDCFLPGKVVVVSHGAGIASAYFHLSEMLVAEGDLVERGTIIGRTGQTGRVTGPHVHLSVWALNDFVDPAEFFRLAFLPRESPLTPAARKSAAEAKSAAADKQKDRDKGKDSG